MNLVTHLCLRVVFGGSALLLAGQSLAARYELQIDIRNPTRGTVRLVLDNPLPSDTAFFTRQLGDSVYLDDPRCEETAEALIRSDMTWIVPRGCSSVIWTTRFETVAEPSFDVSDQMNIYHPSGWWLFAEWGNLLRSRSHQTASQLCALGDYAAACRAVPAANEPPLFMIVGEPRATAVLGGTTFRFFAGHLPDSFDVAELYESYERQLSYLYSITAAREPAAVRQRDIDVVLLGIDAVSNTMGGAAGTNAFLANVVVGDEGVSSAERVRLLWLSGHELSHMLGFGTGTLWASESLAHYYGFKSLGEDEEAEELFDGLIEGAGSVGLLEAHQRVTEHGDGEYYDLFYSKGAAFWREVDNLVSAATAGGSSLDEFLPLLLNGTFGPGGELPSEFTGAVSKIVDPGALEEVISEYL